VSDSNNAPGRPLAIIDERLVRGQLEQVLESVREGQFELAKAALGAAQRRLKRCRSQLSTDQVRHLKALLDRAEAAIVRRAVDLLAAGLYGVIALALYAY